MNGEKQQTGRRIFLHDVPPWVDAAASDFFITICCKRRETNQLCLTGIGEALLDSAKFYRERQKWFPWLFLLMPDHVHMIVASGQGRSVETVLAGWKRFTATKYRIAWQQGFFEHRLRRNESADEKAQYIRQNSIRAGLVNEVEEWPFLLEFEPI